MEDELLIDKVKIRGFKGFGIKREIDFSNLTLLFGGNSSGKSTTIQSLMILKQTCVSKGSFYDLLINGKYMSLGNWNDIIYRRLDGTKAETLEFGIDVSSKENELGENFEYNWEFKHSPVKPIDNKYVNNIYLKSFELTSVTEKFDFEENDKNVLVNSNTKSRINSIVMDKLLPQSVEIKYNEKYNDLIIEFIGELYESLFNQLKDKKIKRMKKNLDYEKDKTNIEESISLLTSTYLKEDHFHELETSYSKTDVIFGALELIRKMEVGLGLESGGLSQGPNFILLIVSASSLIDLKERVEAYQTKITEITNDTTEAFREIKLNNENQVSRVSDIEEFSQIYTASETISSVLSRIKYLGPIRERPRGNYDYDADNDPSYVGMNGQHLPFILTHFKDLKILTPMPDGKENEIKFEESLNTWLKYIGLADKVKTDIDHGIELSVIEKGIKSKIGNVGIGVSQVLPVLALGLLSQKEDILIFEQPELHLHPSAQSKLVDFFVNLIKHGRQIIIETHSEYFLHRLRYLILDGKIEEEKIKILFFDKTVRGVTVKQGELNESGNFKYPKNYKDTTEDLIKKILDKKIERM